MVRVNDTTISPQCRPENAGALCDARHISLVGISTGVAVGRRLQVKHNANVESWTLFTTLDQFDTCLTTGSLRFEDPVLFAQVKREFEHVFTHAGPLSLDPGESPSS